MDDCQNAHGNAVTQHSGSNMVPALRYNRPVAVPCQVRDQLRADYDAARQEFHAALNDLNMHSPFLSAIYPPHIRQARHKMTKLRLTIHQHCKEHGCELPLSRTEGGSGVNESASTC